MSRPESEICSLIDWKQAPENATHFTATMLNDNTVRAAWRAQVGGVFRDGGRADAPDFGVGRFLVAGDDSRCSFTVSREHVPA